MLKNVLKICCLLSISFVVYLICSTNFNGIKDLEDNMLITQSEIESINNENKLGTFIRLKSNNSFYVRAADGESVKSSLLSVKLFDFFPIKTLPVTMVEKSEVCVGGNSVGLVLKTDGAIIVGFNTVNSENGKISPFEKSCFKVGDRVISIAGKKITTIKDIEDVSLTFNGESVEIVAMRKEKEIKQNIIPIYDIYTKSYKLGLWVRDDAAGVGTLTFASPTTSRFGALGHAICETSSSSILPISGGELYSSEVVGISKGSRGKAGELKGFFISGRNEEGTIEKNTSYGVFGKLNETSKYLKNKKYEVGGRLSVKPGKATILCCLDGDKVEEYEIEIIKTNYQRKSNDKSLVLRVVDKELIEKTGGIVQGMSGSPIIQNNKIVGAVTHVFVNDPLKGFGIYMDWMYNN